MTMMLCDRWWWWRRRKKKRSDHRSTFYVSVSFSILRTHGALLVAKFNFSVSSLSFAFLTAWLLLSPAPPALLGRYAAAVAPLPFVLKWTCVCVHALVHDTTTDNIIINGKLPLLASISFLLIIIIGILRAGNIFPSFFSHPSLFFLLSPFLSLHSATCRLSWPSKMAPALLKTWSTRCWKKEEDIFEGHLWTWLVTCFCPFCQSFWPRSKGGGTCFASIGQMVLNTRKVIDGKNDLWSWRWLEISMNQPTCLFFLHTHSLSRDKDRPSAAQCPHEMRRLFAEAVLRGALFTSCPISCFLFSTYAYTLSAT